MKKLNIFIIAIYFMAMSCQNDKIASIPVDIVSTEGDFFKENMALLDLRIRSISNINFVKEVYIGNFSTQKWDKNILVLNENNYQDDGLENDVKANDGIYTSTETFLHDKVRPYKSNAKLYSVLESPIIDPKFTQKQKLHSFIDSYELRSAESITNSCYALRLYNRDDSLNLQKKLDKSI
jgi:hypothetical protein